MIITPAAALLATNADNEAGVAIPRDLTPPQDPDQAYVFGVARDGHGEPLNPFGSYAVYVSYAGRSRNDFVAWASVNENGVVTLVDEDEEFIARVTTQRMLFEALKDA